MPSYLFQSDTNQQLFEAELDAQRIDYSRTDIIGEVVVEDDRFSDIARELGADFN